MTTRSTKGSPSGLPTRPRRRNRGEAEKRPATIAKTPLANRWADEGLLADYPADHPANNPRIMSQIWLVWSTIPFWAVERHALPACDIVQQFAQAAENWPVPTEEQVQGIRRLVALHRSDWTRLARAVSLHHDRWVRSVIRGAAGGAVDVRRLAAVEKRLDELKTKAELPPPAESLRSAIGEFMKYLDEQDARDYYDSWRWIADEAHPLVLEAWKKAGKPVLPGYKSAESPVVRVVCWIIQQCGADPVPSLEALAQHYKRRVRDKKYTNLRQKSP